MPIDARLDSGKRIVFATPRGKLTHEDMVSYQKRVWSRPGVTGYDELIDMTEVDTLEFEAPAKVREVADLSASTDGKRSRSRIAIVARDKLHVALGRMYREYRNSRPGARAEVRIFPGVEDALRWLRPPKGKERRGSAPRARVR